MGGGEGSGSWRKSMLMTLKMPESTPTFTSEREHLQEEMWPHDLASHVERQRADACCPHCDFFSIS
jgi:hypothetical protein